MEDSYGVRRRDTTKGPPLRVLSLDGGGVRGYSMLIIIQELMHRTFVETEGRAPRRHEIPKPCEHFDLIVGTGTGGLIALMLGRLRLDLETCKELYVRMTRVVFETDKTIAGIPYRSTLFKASKLEEAIRSAVREHTIFEKEGNDGIEPDTANPLGTNPRRHISNASTVSFSARSPAMQMSRTPTYGTSRYGDANARLYDAREARTKTVVTAMYRGSPKGAPPAMLRSYDSRKEPAPEFDCKIWQAGRATCSIGLAFKPMQIGQSSFHDDGGGNFNPSPDALDEAVINEWPGREIGVFVSVGTGRRPKGSDANQHMWYEDFMGEFAEARRRLVAKIEGCEKIHEYMLREHLMKRGANVENYFRLNVEVGVGEFGMNEWHRLGDISTSTRRYMGRPDEQKMIQGISIRLAKILKAKIRWERAERGLPPDRTASWGRLDSPLMAELMGDDPEHLPVHHSHSPARDSYNSGQDNIDMNRSSPRNSSHYDEQSRPGTGDSALSPAPLVLRPPTAPSPGNPPRRPPRPDELLDMAPTPAQYRHASGEDKIAIMSPDEYPKPPPFLQTAPPPQRIEPPPLPPKTPLPERQAVSRPKPPAPAPPYPMDEEQPPPVNMARKPDFRNR